ncbi:hypothetical protein SNE40_016189 [Patella caerulea]|uniref:Transmembrane protein n=1 Tax=Patella caerulea TaxID=87958 RepID=A0AAN8PCT6_PATCE
MKSMLVIFALAVLNCINVANGDCTAATGDGCKTTYEATNKTTDGQKCTALYTYGKCLVDAMCYEGSHKTDFDTAETSAGCGDCKTITGIECFKSNCSAVATVKTCLDDAKCNTGDFKTAYDKFEAGCNGCGTVTVSVLMMFLSTLLIFIKNY